MYCENCGTELADNATFCSNCGNRIRANRKKNIYIALLLTFILTGLGSIYAGNVKKGVILLALRLLFAALGVFLTIFFGPLNAVGYLIGMIVITFITGFINATTPILSPNHSVMTQITIGAFCFFATILMIFI